MNDFIENRHAPRINIGCEVHFKAINSDAIYNASCINLSCTGISFYSEHEFQIDEKIEIHVYPDPPIMFSSLFIATIVRVESQEDNLFKLAARFEFEEENNPR